MMAVIQEAPMIASLLLLKARKKKRVESSPTPKVATIEKPLKKSTPNISVNIFAPDIDLKFGQKNLRFQKDGLPSVFFSQHHSPPVTNRMGHTLASLPPPTLSHIFDYSSSKSSCAIY
jgi:hypothetical protein